MYCDRQGSQAVGFVSQYARLYCDQERLEAAGLCIATRSGGQATIQPLRPRHGAGREAGHATRGAQARCMARGTVTRQPGPATRLRPRP